MFIFMIVYILFSMITMIIASSNEKKLEDDKCDPPAAAVLDAGPSKPSVKKLSQGKAMDVGVDGNNLMPYSLGQIMNIMQTQPIAKLSLPKDHHEKRLI